jgi:hypothetical protein
LEHLYKLVVNFVAMQSLLLRARHPRNAIIPNLFSIVEDNLDGNTIVEQIPLNQGSRGDTHTIARNIKVVENDKVGAKFLLG